MQAKGLIKVFLILLALVCILPIFYTVTSRSYDKKSFVFAESKLKGFNENDKSLSQEVVDSMKDLKTK
jgi:ABC-type glycerol-3-phosphate transport system permease component